MQAGLYVALSGQVALQKRLETIAHNVANASTAGFRGALIPGGVDLGGSHGPARTLRQHEAVAQGPP